MKKNVMSLKATVNNIAKKSKVSAQSVLQTYMLERLLERISVSKYKDNFILKGGMLISAMLGIDSRTTMDIDTTIKGLELTEENVKNIMEDVCSIDLHDDVTLKINHIEKIRDNDDYNGYRLTFEAKYMNTMPVIMKIDVTTGDKITYREIEYSFELMLENRKIHVWSYNVETVLAEKFEAIISRNIDNTRMKDYYDLYMFVNLKWDDIDKTILRKAIFNTSKKRETLNYIEEADKYIELINEDSKLKSLWKNYQNNYVYAKDISFENTIAAIKVINGVIVPAKV